MDDGVGLDMSKVQEAKAILKTLGLPTAQQTDQAAFTVLALAGLEEATPWEKSQRRLLRIHDIKEFMGLSQSI